MAIGAMIVGISGAVIGLILAGVLLLIGGIGASIQSPTAAGALAGGTLAFWMSLVGVVGAAIVPRWRWVGAALMLLDAAALSVGLGGYALIPGALLIVAACLACLARRPQRRSGGDELVS